MAETKKFENNPASKPTTGGLQVDSLLMERYRIVGVVGGGGMGTVFQARDAHFPEAKRLVAIKEMITPQGGDNGQRTAMLKTFKREANILAALSHPAIPKIFDFFVTDSRAYLVMEYINGSDLDALLGRTRTLPVEKVIDWGIELCDVLGYLHSSKPQPIVFRDMKPANIMIDSLGKVRLIDFGIAKIFEKEPDKKHTMIGTEGYSAPEQYRGEVAILSDIYGLGATLHHVLTRKDPRVEPPFSFHERPILSFNPQVPSGLISIVERAVAQKPEDRFQSCEEMKTALEALRGGRGTGAMRPGTNNIYGNSGGLNDGKPRTDFFEKGAAPESIEPRWKFKTEDEIRTSPTISKNIAYVGSYDTNLWAINLEDGKLIWKFPTGAGIASSPAVDEATKYVYVGSEDHVLYAVDSQAGRMGWTYHTKGKIRSSPRIAHNHVFFGSDDGFLYALAANNGRFLWSYEATTPIRSRPFVTNDVIIFGADDGSVYGLELSGKRKWVYRAKRGINSSPIVDPKSNICFVGSFDGYLYALDANSGFTLWRFRTNGPVVSSPALTEDTVFFGSADGIVYAVNTDTGKERWQFVMEKPVVGSPTISGNAVYIGGTDNHFYCLDIKTGKMLWKYKTGGQITSTPAAAENIIIFGSMDHTLYALPTVS